MKPGDAVAFEMRGVPSAAMSGTYASHERFTQVAAIAGPEPDRQGQDPKFRNRERELDDVVNSLDNDDASHFWLWVAPPQLGKTWFLHETGKRLKQRRTRCLVHYADAREIAVASSDPMALLARMYAVSPQRPDALEIARAISRTNRYNLCLLDSAEQLSDDTIRGLREGLEQVNEYVKRGRSRDARLALVVASRQDDAWGGVVPLRLSIRNLTGFEKDVVLDALYDLAVEMDKNYSRSELEPLADQVHRLSEGLPALLAGYVAWIRRADWMGLDRLADRDCFDEIATPYIAQVLLSPDSLCGRRPDPPAELRPAMIAALRALVPYRCFTGSHMSYHARQDPLRDALRRLRWSDEEVWAAVSHTDVLLLPQKEPSHAISPPVRRLLFRHWYASADSRAQAHRRAREFLSAYGQSLTGVERAKVIIECLWHDAEALSLSQDPGKAHLLTELARGLSAELSEAARTEAARTGGAGVIVPGFRQQEIRDCVDRLMRDDEELVRAIGARDLFASIREIMRRPDGGNMP